VASAPWLFTKIMASVKVGIDLSRLSLFQYLDDWLGECLAKGICDEQAATLVKLCYTLGLMVNFKKSELIPSQRFTFIGIDFDLLEGKIYPTAKNVGKILDAVAQFLRCPNQTAKDWESLLGILGSQDRFIPWGRFHLRPIQLHFQSVWRPSTGLQSDRVPVPESLHSHLQWWNQEYRLLRGVPLEPPEFKVKLFTDASTKGWGAHLDNRTAQGSWSAQERLLHINVLEMRAVRLSLLAFKVPPQSNILVATDNSTVVAYVNKQGGTRSRDLWEETKPLLILAIHNKWNLKARHIPGRLNVIADQLSRAGQVLPTEWSLHQDVVQWIFQELGTPMVDLFATKYNNKLMLYVSPVPDTQAMDTDALSISWENMSAYAYPPHQILPQVLQKFRMTEVCSMILVAPHWPNQVWFPELLRLAQPNPLPLPQWKSLLKQPRSRLFHTNPSVLQLHAWKLERGHCRPPGSPTL
jgi:ribonuclease HI